MENINEILIENGYIDSEFDLYDKSLSITPNKLSIFNSYSETEKKATLLQYKAMYTSYGKDIFRFHTKHIKGFQFGNPKFENSVRIHLFGNKENKYDVQLFGVNQEEIDLILSSIQEGASDVHN